MREIHRTRLEALEEARALQDGKPHLINIVFPPAESTVARGKNPSFECWRLGGEDEDVFKARAHAEFRAITDPRPFQILIFFFDDQEISQT